VTLIPLFRNIIAMALILLPSVLNFISGASSKSWDCARISCANASIAAHASRLASRRFDGMTLTLVGAQVCASRARGTVSSRAVTVITHCGWFKDCKVGAR